MEIKKLLAMEGCVHWCWEINDKDLQDYTPAEQREILHALVDMMTDEDVYNTTQEAVKSVCEDIGDYECDDEPCECCGDYTSTWTWEDKEGE